MRASLNRRLILALAAGAIVVRLLAIAFHWFWRSYPVGVSESQGMVVCRMECCVFRFPLPAGAHIESITSLAVNGDTIKGNVFTSEGDAQPYDVVLQKHGFSFKPGCPMAYSKDQPGGWVWPHGGRCVEFSYFGDR